MSGRDMQKQRVYDAEHMVQGIMDSVATNDVHTFDFHGSTLILPEERKFGDIAGVQRYVDAVLGLNWVQAQWKKASVPVRVRKRKTAHQAHYESLTCTIAVPDHQGRHHSWAMREIVILHEIAHHLTGWDDKEDGAHGSVFSGIMIKLVTELMGQEVGLLFQESFERHGVKIKYVV